MALQPVFFRAASVQQQEVRTALKSKRAAAQKRSCASSVNHPSAKRQRVTPFPHVRPVDSAISDYVVVVPSYPHDDRIKILKSHTLAMLAKQGVPRRRINLVVATSAERKLYAASLRGRVSNILVATKGIVEVREWIGKNLRNACTWTTVSNRTETGGSGGAEPPQENPSRIH